MSARVTLRHRSRGADQSVAQSIDAAHARRRVTIYPADYVFGAAHVFVIGCNIYFGPRLTACRYFAKVGLSREQKRRFEPRPVTSGVTPTSDFWPHRPHCREKPTTDMCTVTNITVLFDHLIRKQLHCAWYCEAKRIGGSHIN